MKYKGKIKTVKNIIIASVRLKHIYIYASGKAYLINKYVKQVPKECSKGLTSIV